MLAGNIIRGVIIPRPLNQSHAAQPGLTVEQAYLHHARAARQRCRPGVSDLDNRTFSDSPRKPEKSLRQALRKRDNSAAQSRQHSPAESGTYTV